MAISIIFVVVVIVAALVSVLKKEAASKGKSVGSGSDDYAICEFCGREFEPYPQHLDCVVCRDCELNYYSDEDNFDI